MSAAIRQGVAAAVVAVVAVFAVSVLFAGCTINLEGKKACNGISDCVSGYACVAHICTLTGGGGTTGGGDGGGTPGTIDGGPDASLPRMCPTNTVTACSDPGTSCAETFCGGRLWRAGVKQSLLVLYRFSDPSGMFSDSDRMAIRAGAAAWTRASSGFVTFQECITNCMGKVISVVPGDTDGITNPDADEQFLPMPIASSGGRASPHRIAHQWGHVAGLAHTYERADRDRYVAFDKDRWCPPGGTGLPPHCAAGTGTFGVFDGKSKMNGFHRDGICGAEEPEEDSDEPTIGDLSALAELFFGATSPVVPATTIPFAWSPFQPIGQDLSPTQPLDYQLVPGVDPMGSPALAEIDYASPEIFVRGTDDHIYTTTRSDPSASTPGWRKWTSVVDGVDADPAVVFAVNADPATLYLAVRSLDGNIYLSARRDTTWGAWTSLGAPPSGAASAPAIASQNPFLQAVVVRGGDGLIYSREVCTDPLPNCPASALGPDPWRALPPPLPPPASNIFVGKPSAVWPQYNDGLTVAAIRDDRVAVVINHVESGGISWLPAVNVDLAPDDPNPGVAITMTWMAGGVEFFGRNRQGLLVSETVDAKSFPIGGVLVSPPGAVAMYTDFVRTDVAAIIDDHGHPGVWWRYNDRDYAAPCNYNRPGPGNCGVCGLP